MSPIEQNIDPTIQPNKAAETLIASPARLGPEPSKELPAASPQEVRPAEPHQESRMGGNAPPNGGGEHSTLERLRHYEAIIERGLGNKDEPALALLRIHDQKLYKLTHKSFRLYCKERWGFGGSRGYQLIGYAKTKLACMDNGQPPPANERQSRQLGPDGMVPRRHQPSYERRLGRVLAYLQRNLAKSFVAEPQRFLQDVRQGLDRLEHQLVTKPPVQVQTRTASAPSQLVPSAQTGSVLGMSMTEAKRIGYVR